jgi:uncharacterized membrane protein YkvA (DUF1232 family)
MFLRLARLARSCGRDVLVLFHACRRPETPLQVKLASILLALYVISPVDLIPDLIPLLGWLDDAVLLALLLPVIIRMVPEPIIREASLASDQTLERWPFSRNRS